MTQSEAYKKGEAIRRSLRTPAEHAKAQAQYDGDPVMKKFIEAATESVFGTLWSRPGLDLKMRTLVCVISDAATGREPELDLHMRLALRQGWTEDELTEVLLHLMGYVGAPLVREACLLASRVFKEERAKAKA
jgi:4-carboxymuconolactone decarboxylase